MPARHCVMMHVLAVCLLLAVNMATAVSHHTPTRSRLMTHSPTYSDDRTLTETGTRQSPTRSPSFENTLTFKTPSVSHTTSAEKTSSRSDSPSWTLAKTRTRTSTKTPAKTVSFSISISRSNDLTASRSVSKQSASKSETVVKTGTPRSRSHSLSFEETLTRSRSVTPPPSHSKSLRLTDSNSKSATQQRSMSKSSSRSVATPSWTHNSPTESFSRSSEVTMTRSRTAASPTASKSWEMTMTRSHTKTPPPTPSLSTSRSHSASVAGSASTSSTFSRSPSRTLLDTPTRTLVPSPSHTWTPEATQTVTRSSERSASRSFTDSQGSKTKTLKATRSHTESGTLSRTSTRSLSSERSRSFTKSATMERSLSRSSTASRNATLSNSNEQTASASHTETARVTLSTSATTSRTRSTTVSPSPLRTASRSKSSTIETTPSVTRTITPPPTRTHTRSVSTSETVSRSRSRPPTRSRSPSPSSSLSRTVPRTRSFSLSPSATASTTLSNNETRSDTSPKTASASATPTVTRTITPPPTHTKTRSWSPTNDRTLTRSKSRRTPTASRTPTMVLTNSGTRSQTVTRHSPSWTNTRTATRSRSPTLARTASASATLSPTVDRSTTASPSRTESSKPSVSLTWSLSARPTATLTRSVTPPPTPSLLITATNSSTVARTASVSLTHSQQSPTKSLTADRSASRTESLTFTLDNSVTKSPTETISRTSQPTRSTSSTPSVAASLTITLTLSRSNPSRSRGTDTLTQTDTVDVTSTATQLASVTPTGNVTVTVVTQSPTSSGTIAHTASPSHTSSVEPTGSRSPATTTPTLTAQVSQMYAPSRTYQFVITIERQPWNPYQHGTALQQAIVDTSSGLLSTSAVFVFPNVQVPFGADLPLVVIATVGVTVATDSIATALRATFGAEAPLPAGLVKAGVVLQRRGDDPYISPSASIDYSLFTAVPGEHLLDPGTNRSLPVVTACAERQVVTATLGTNAYGVAPALFWLATAYTNLGDGTFVAAPNTTTSIIATGTSAATLFGLPADNVTVVVVTAAAVYFQFRNDSLIALSRLPTPSTLALLSQWDAASEVMNVSVASITPLPSSADGWRLLPWVVVDVNSVPATDDACVATIVSQSFVSMAQSPLPYVRVQSAQPFTASASVSNLRCPGLVFTSSTLVVPAPRTSCVASFQCNNHGDCASDLTCTCSAGWRGSRCDTCNVGYTVESACTVLQCTTDWCGNGVCASDGTCQCYRDATNGYWAGATCTVCATGFAPPLCTSCLTGLYGTQCNMACDADSSCNGHGQCDATGACACYASKSGGYWSGSDCTNCAAPYAGSNCDTACSGSTTCSGHGVCNDAGACDCYSTDRQGYWTTSTTATLSNPPVYCDVCQSGYSGTSCTQKPTFGGTCAVGYTCISGYCLSGGCQCVDDSSNGHWTGATCASCVQDASAGRWTGLRCNVCSDGYWGSSCSFSCSHSRCGGHGSCPSSAPQPCTCQQSAQLGFWTGADCSSCVAGYYGIGCASSCAGCLHGSCSGAKGCVCNGLWTGPRCNVCPSRYVLTSAGDCVTFAPSLTNVFMCDSYASCNNRGTCVDPTDASGNTATCSCTALYTGITCAECVSATGCGVAASLPSCDVSLNPTAMWLSSLELLVSLPPRAVPVVPPNDTTIDVHACIALFQVTPYASWSCTRVNQSFVLLKRLVSLFADSTKTSTTSIAMRALTTSTADGHSCLVPASTLTVGSSVTTSSAAATLMSECYVSVGTVAVNASTESTVRNVDSVTPSTSGYIPSSRCASLLFVLRCPQGLDGMAVRWAAAYPSAYSALSSTVALSATAAASSNWTLTLTPSMLPVATPVQVSAVVALQGVTRSVYPPPVRRTITDLPFLRLVTTPGPPVLYLDAKVSTTFNVSVTWTWPCGFQPTGFNTALATLSWTLGAVVVRTGRADLTAEVSLDSALFSLGKNLITVQYTHPSLSVSVMSSLNITVKVHDASTLLPPALLPSSNPIYVRAVGGAVRVDALCPRGSPSFNVSGCGGRAWCEVALSSAVNATLGALVLSVDSRLWIDVTLAVSVQCVLPTVYGSLYSSVTSLATVEFVAPEDGFPIVNLEVSRVDPSAGGVTVIAAVMPGPFQSSCWQQFNTTWQLQTPHVAILSTDNSKAMSVVVPSSALSQNFDSTTLLFTATSASCGSASAYVALQPIQANATTTSVAERRPWTNQSWHLAVSPAVAAPGDAVSLDVVPSLTTAASRASLVTVVSVCVTDEERCLPVATASSATSFANLLTVPSWLGDGDSLTLLVELWFDRDDVENGRPPAVVLDASVLVSSTVVNTNVAVGTRYHAAVSASDLTTNAALNEVSRSLGTTPTSSDIAMVTAALISVNAALLSAASSSLTGGGIATMLVGALATGERMLVRFYATGGAGDISAFRRASLQLLQTVSTPSMLSSWHWLTTTTSDPTAASLLNSVLSLLSTVADADVTRYRIAATLLANAPKTSVGSQASAFLVSGCSYDSIDCTIALNTTLSDSSSFNTALRLVSTNVTGAVVHAVVAWAAATASTVQLQVIWRSSAPIGSTASFAPRNDSSSAASSRRQSTVSLATALQCSSVSGTSGTNPCTVRRASLSETYSVVAVPLPAHGSYATIAVTIPPATPTPGTPNNGTGNQPLNATLTLSDLTWTPGDTTATLVGGLAMIAAAIIPAGIAGCIGYRRRQQIVVLPSANDSALRFVWMYARAVSVLSSCVKAADCTFPRLWRASSLMTSLLVALALASMGSETCTYYTAMRVSTTTPLWVMATLQGLFVAYLLRLLPLGVRFVRRLREGTAALSPVVTVPHHVTASDLRIMHPASALPPLTGDLLVQSFLPAGTMEKGAHHAAAAKLAVTALVMHTETDFVDVEGEDEEEEHVTHSDWSDAISVNNDVWVDLNDDTGVGFLPTTVRTFWDDVSRDPEGAVALACLLIGKTRVGAALLQTAALVRCPGLYSYLHPESVQPPPHDVASLCKGLFDDTAMAIAKEVLNRRWPSLEEDFGAAWRRELPDPHCAATVCALLDLGRDDSLSPTESFQLIVFDSHDMPSTANEVLQWAASYLQRGQLLAAAECLSRLCRGGFDNVDAAMPPWWHRLPACSRTDGAVGRLMALELAWRAGVNDAATLMVEEQLHLHHEARQRRVKEVIPGPQRLAFTWRNFPHGTSASLATLPTDGQSDVSSANEVTAATTQSTTSATPPSILSYEASNAHLIFVDTRPHVMRCLARGRSNGTAALPCRTLADAFELAAAAASEEDTMSNSVVVDVLKSERHARLMEQGVIDVILVGGTGTLPWVTRGLPACRVYPYGSASIGGTAADGTDDTERAAFVNCGVVDVIATRDMDIAAVQCTGFTASVLDDLTTGATPEIRYYNDMAHPSQGLGIAYTLARGFVAMSLIGALVLIYVTLSTLSTRASVGVRGSSSNWGAAWWPTALSRDVCDPVDWTSVSSDASVLVAVLQLMTPTWLVVIVAFLASDGVVSCIVAALVFIGMSSRTRTSHRGWSFL